MYKAYIADDEIYTRKGLQKHFDWKKYGIELVGEASNGVQAYEELETSPVDILITDVKMPQMDGIELASRIRERYPQTKIIFISGHDDLEYLKSSLKLGAIDYILKSIDLEELARTIERVTGIIESENKMEALRHDLEKQVRQSMPLLRERFLTRLVKDAIPPNADQQMEFLGLPLRQNGTFCLVIASVQNYFDVYRDKGEYDRQLFSFAVLNIFQEIVDHHFTGCAFETRTGEFTAILMIEKDAEFETGLLEIASEIQEALERHLSVQIRFGISEIVSGLDALKDCYADTLKSIERKNYLGQNKTVVLASFHDERKDEVVFWKDQLCDKILKGDTNEVLQLLRNYFASCERQEDVLQSRLFFLLQYLYMEFPEYQKYLPAGFSSLRAVCERFFCCRDIKEMKEMTEESYAAFCQISQKRQENPLDSVIQRIQDCIRERYAENLSVSEIAESVYLTPTYICLLFKQETGITINDYLTATRIKKAKEFLRDPEKKLYDICYLVGYNSPSYFSKLFKRMTGSTPSEYRTLLTSSLNKPENLL